MKQLIEPKSWPQVNLDSGWRRGLWENVYRFMMVVKKIKQTKVNYHIKIDCQLHDNLFKLK